MSGRRGKCCKRYTVEGHCDERYIIRSQWDGCKEFAVATSNHQNEADERMLGSKENCMACGCHWSFHEKPKREHDVVHSNNTPQVQELYTECCKNQILKQFFANEGEVNDGCQEFVPGPHGFELICAGCSCHMSFHKKKKISVE